MIILSLFLLKKEKYVGNLVFKPVSCSSININTFFRFFGSQSEDIELKIEDSHKKLTGLQPSQAENR
jgi:hypothetical protein